MALNKYQNSQDFIVISICILDYRYLMESEFFNIINKQTKKLKLIALLALRQVSYSHQSVRVNFFLIFQTHTPSTPTTPPSSPTVPVSNPLNDPAPGRNKVITFITFNVVKDICTPNYNEEI